MFVVLFTFVFLIDTIEIIRNVKRHIREIYLLFRNKHLHKYLKNFDYLGL